MHSFPRFVRIGWLLLHFLLITLICAHETLWLIDKQLTIAERPSSRFWKRVEKAPAALLASNLSSDNFYRRLIATYTNLTGIEVGYGYFAPNVPETHALVFELHYPDDHLEYESPMVTSHEGQLRLTSLIEQIGRTDYDDWRNELNRRLARSTWRQHPTAISIRGFFGSVTPPTLNAYRSGKNERRFTCQYVYDFEHILQKEDSDRP